MKNDFLPQLSMEAISYQGRSLLFFELKALLDMAREAGGIKDQASLERLGLRKVISDRTGINISPALLFNSSAADLSVTVPVLDSQNPIHRMKVDGNEHTSAYEYFQAAVRVSDQLKGSIDLKKGRVSGVFEQLPCFMLIPVELFSPHSTFSSEEVAAGMVHEVGHAFSFMECIGQQVSTNAVATTAINALRNEADKKIQVQLVGQALSVMKINEKEVVEALLEENSDDNEKMIILVRAADKARYDYLKTLDDGRSDYDYRSIEYLADQFAVRQGAAVPLASFLHKLGASVSPDYGRTRISFLTSQAMRYGLVLGLFFIPHVAAGMVASGILGVASYLGFSYGRHRDKVMTVSERIGRVKQDLVQILKNPKLSQNYRKQVLNDLEMIEEIRKNIKEHTGLFEFLWRSLPGVGRRAAQTREFQKGLEDLINTDLFKTAAQLRSINSR